MAWPRIKVSRWLVATVFVTGVLSLGLIAWEQHTPGASVWKSDYFQEFRTGPGLSTAELAFGIVFNAGLIWFTFFSGNKRVTKDDKVFVILMQVGAAIAFLTTAFHHFFRN